jgi:hypothetical protein
MPHLYIISCGESGVKIGHSESPGTRLKHLQTGCPLPLSLSWCGLNWKKERMLKMEARVHELLSHARQTNEWFSVTVDQALEAITDAWVELGSGSDNGWDFAPE